MNELEIEIPTLFSLAGINLLGQSNKFQAAIGIIVRMAACDANVLIQGETGTGKELGARAIHYLSARKDYPFIPVNCGAIPESLFESEFFGFTKGAFTDAKSDNQGLVSRAEGGTLFLDEIECLSLKGQAVLLRFLQDQSYRPLGGGSKTANLRVVAASNRDLLKMAQGGEFRLDLYYRLALLTLTMPPLRERIGDASFLARHFITYASEHFKVPSKSLHPCTLEWLDRHDWPGNVRELENWIYRQMLLSDQAEIQMQLGKSERRQTPDRRKKVLLHLPYQEAKGIAVKEFEQIYLTGLLEQTKGNISAAARQAGKERRSFERLINKVGIDKALFRY